MNKRIFNFFTNDHARIEKILDRATEDINDIKKEDYRRFRIALMTHIKMEEKILFPAAQKANGGVPVPLAAQLRLEHGAITSLMVPPPTPDLIKVLRHVIAKHDLKEEEPGGMYDICENLTGDQTDEILQQLLATSEVPMHPHNLAPFALEAAKRAVKRAGYDYDQILNTPNREL